MTVTVFVVVVLAMQPTAMRGIRKNDERTVKLRNGESSYGAESFGGVGGCGSVKGTVTGGREGSPRMALRLLTRGSLAYGLAVHRQPGAVARRNMIGRNRNTPGISVAAY